MEKLSLPLSSCLESSCLPDFSWSSSIWIFCKQRSHSLIEGWSAHHNDSCYTRTWTKSVGWCSQFKLLTSEFVQNACGHSGMISNARTITMGECTCALKDYAQSHIIYSRYSRWGYSIPNGCVRVCVCACGWVIVVKCQPVSQSTVDGRWLGVQFKERGAPVPDFMGSCRMIWPQIPSVTPKHSLFTNAEWNLQHLHRW